MFALEITLGQPIKQVCPYTVHQWIDVRGPGGHLIGQFCAGCPAQAEFMCTAED